MVRPTARPEPFRVCTGPFTLPSALPIARVHPPRLERPAIGAGRNFTIGVLAGQPDLDVIGLLRRKTHVAGAQRHHPMRQVELLEHLLRRIGHALMLGRWTGRAW